MNLTDKMSEMFGSHGPEFRAVMDETKRGMTKASVITLQDKIGNQIVEAGYSKFLELAPLPAKAKDALKDGIGRSLALTVVGVTLGILSIAFKNKLSPKYRMFFTLAQESSFLVAAKNGVSASGLQKLLDMVIPMDIQQDLGALAESMSEEAVKDILNSNNK